MLFGATWLVLIRAVTLDTATTHYHGNFALYIDGEHEEFSEPTFYEEVSSCGSEANSPLTRAHMHDMIGDVVHVHDASSTWGNLFENLGLVLGNNVLYSRTNTYVDGNPGRLSFILNGKPVQSIANRAIQSEDRLLISYGSEDASELMQRFEAIDQSAAEYNQTADPSACSGSQELGFADRIKLVLGIK